MRAKNIFFIFFIAFGVHAVINSCLFVVCATLLSELLLTQAHTTGHISPVGNCSLIIVLFFTFLSTTDRSHTFS